MAKKKQPQLHAKFYGGPKDGDSYLIDRADKYLYFFSKHLVIGDFGVHGYVDKASYMAGGYEFHCYWYLGVWASDSTTPHPRPARGPKLGPVDIEGEL